MKKSLFVAGLDFAITDNDLQELFSAYGTVESAKVVTDRNSGRSRGFGFVDMSSQEEAEKCIQNLNDTTHNNRQLAVRFKEDRADTKPRGGSSNRW